MMVESTFALVNLTTGIEMRDEHMKNKYLQVKEFPQAVLKIESINLPEGFEEKATNIKEQNFSGKLSMHGVEREVSGTFSLSESLELSARFILKLTDFGIEIPNYLGVVVADTVTVETTFSLIKKTIEKSK
jgi:polyisoprenoid-binding protein YceI